MLSCRNLNVLTSDGKPILKDATVGFMPRAMNAVIGPSGCGKTTLIKAMLRIIDADGGSFFGAEEISDSGSLVGKVGFAPQFTCAHTMLTVEEVVKNALDFSVSDAAVKGARAAEILKTVGLDEHAQKFVGSLSGGQLRRIGLAIDLANNPALMCCDEVTSGLDPLSENAILDLLSRLCRDEKKTFVCVIHNLAKLDYFDCITVVFEGEIVFQGTLPELKAHFGIDSALSLYDRLNAIGLEKLRQMRDGEKSESIIKECMASAPVHAAGARPSAARQLAYLLLRRYKLFFRDTTYLLLTIAISFGFPLVVVIFAAGGLPEIENLALERNLGALEELKQSLRAQISAANTSSIVVGLILFQVVLLSLMGANNSASEIAGERNLYEKERLIGLSPLAYAVSKLVFTASLAVFQGVWMCLFVKFVCKFPGDALVQCAQLSMVSAAMTFICLGFSAVFVSAAKANMVSIYLVGFQLPLSGVVLALPEALKWVCRPFIATYWGWAGYMSSMSDNAVYDAYMLTKMSPEFMPSPALAAAVLAVQAALAVAVVFWGCLKRKWS